MDELLSIDRYKIVRLDSNEQGGGLAVFVSEDLQFEIRHDMPLHNLELILLKVVPYGGVPFNLVLWYRSSNASIDSFTLKCQINGIPNNQGGWKNFQNLMNGAGSEF